MAEIPAPRSDSSLEALVAGYAQAPLRFLPGSQWEYSNAGINTLGRIVEVVSGEPFAAFLQRRILDPLGMADTTFWPTTGQAARLAKVYRSGAEDAGLQETPTMIITTSVTDRTRTPLPAGGLYSTAADLLSFYRLMLAGGQLNGVRLLSPEAHRLLTSTQSGDIPTGFTPGMSWGLGFQVVKAPQGATAMFSPGTYGHGGAYATQSWADPTQGRIFIFLVQQAGLGNSDAWPVRAVLQEAAVLRDPKSPVSDLK
jgi:CubicO group peptidase (beta-lactamase class C family)